MDRVHAIANNANEVYRQLLAFIRGVAVFLLVCGGTIKGQQGEWKSKVSEQKPDDRYGRLPLAFEENRGQTSSQVRFLTRGRGYLLFLTEQSVVIETSGQSTHPVSAKPEFAHTKPSGDNRLQEPNHKVSVLGLELAGSRPQFQISGEDLLRGSVDYFIGNDPSKWHSGIPTFAKVRYAEVYRGIDLVFYGNEQHLEYDFVIAPGSDPKSIRLRIKGGRTLALKRDGDLAISIGEGTLSLHKPEIYQSVGNRRIAVNGSFVLFGHNSVSFQVGKYDHTRPLVIDPVLSYSTLIAGATDGSGVTGLAVNAAGEAFVTGWTIAPGFPTTPGAFQGTNPVPGDSYAVFVSKLNATGTTLEYSTFVGGTAATSAINGIAIDSSDNAYIVGATSSTDFPTTPGAFQTVNHAQNNQTGFVAKLNSTGTALMYSTYLGGSVTANPTHNPGQDRVAAIAVDGSGNAYLTGFTVCSDFPITQGAFQSKYPSANTSGVAYATEMNSTGTGLVYSTYLAGSVLDRGQTIAVDAAGNAYIAGTTESSDYPVTAGAFQRMDQSTGYTAMVTKVNPTGEGLVYSTFLGGWSGEGINSIAVDASGDAFVTGSTISHNFPVTTGAYQTSDHEGQAGFVTKLNPSGSGLIYSTFLGGSTDDGGAAITLDAAGNAYVAGASISTDFPVTPGAFDTTNEAWLVSAETTGTLSVLNQTGTGLLYSTYFGGSGSETGYLCTCAAGIGLDASGNVYVAGRTASEDFPTTPGAFLTTLEADRAMPPSGFSETNAFVVKFDASEMKSLPASTTTVTSSVNPQLIDSPVSFKAQVLPAAGAHTPTGLIGFDLDHYIWTTAALDQTGSATYTPPNNLMYWGTHTLSAVYLGDGSNSPSSEDLTETINEIPTRMTFSTNASSATYGTPLIFTVSVTGTPPLPIPGGIVNLSDGNTSLPTLTLDANGQASFTTTTLPIGTNVVFAGYLDTNHEHASTTATITETILPLGVTPTPTFSIPSGTYTTVQTVAISDSMPGAAIFYTTDGSAPTINSTPYTGPTTVSSPETIEGIAVASGYSVSVVASASYMVILPGFTLSASPAYVTVGQGGSATATIAVSDVSGFSGSVTLSISSLPNGVTGSFAPGSTFGTQVLTVTASTSAQVTSAPITVTISGISGSFTATTTIALSISSEPGFTAGPGGTTSMTLVPGATSGNTGAVSVAGMNGFSGTVSLACSVTTAMTAVSDMPTCSLSPPSVTINGTASQTSTLTVNTIAGSSAANRIPRFPWRSAGGTALAFLLLFRAPKRRRRWLSLFGLVLVLVASVDAAGCGSGGGGSGIGGSSSNSGTTPGIYMIAVTGTSGANNARVGTITLTVQ